MSGKIDFKTRQSRSKDPKYSYYPEWYLEIVGENGKTITVSPPYREVIKILKKIFLHEYNVDKDRHNRIPQAPRIANDLKQLGDKCLKYLDESSIV